MDIRNYTWIGSFESANVTTKEPKSTQSYYSKLNNQLVTMKIIMAVVGGILGTALIIVCGYLFYRWNQKKKKAPTLIIPSATTGYNHNEHNLPGAAVDYNEYN